MLLVISGAYTLGLFLRLYGTDVEGTRRVHVRWAPDVTSAQRAVLEGRHGLTAGANEGAGAVDTSPEGRTWSYQLTDTTSANISRLIEDPAVEDTSLREELQDVTAEPADRTLLNGEQHLVFARQA